MKVDYKSILPEIKVSPEIDLNIDNKILNLDEKSAI